MVQRSKAYIPLYSLYPLYYLYSLSEEYIKRQYNLRIRESFNSLYILLYPRDIIPLYSPNSLIPYNSLTTLGIPKGIVD